MKDSNSQPETQIDRSWIPDEFINSITNSVTVTSYVSALSVIGVIGFVSYGYKISNDIKRADLIDSDLPVLHQKVIRCAEIVSSILPKTILHTVGSCFDDDVYTLFAVVIMPVSAALGGAVGATVGLGSYYAAELIGEMYTYYNDQYDEGTLIT